MNEADANLHGMCLMLFISSFELPVYAVCSKCCVLFSVYGNEATQHSKAKQQNEIERKEKKITTTTATATYIKRKRMKKEEKKYRARDKSNRNVENNTQCSELCL